jgi:hypothetical protein
MNSPTHTDHLAEPDAGKLEIALRSLWICVQVAAAYLLAEQVSPFFYQQF